MIIRLLGAAPAMTLRALAHRAGAEPDRVCRIVEQLKREGLVRQDGAYLALP
jgi:DNA-binding IclR family transcriptional regulator